MTESRSRTLEHDNLARSHGSLAVRFNDLVQKYAPLVKTQQERERAQSAKSAQSTWHSSTVG